MRAGRCSLLQRIAVKDVDSRQVDLRARVSPPLSSLARPPARHQSGGGLSFAGRRAALVPAPAATVCRRFFLPASGNGATELFSPIPSASSGRLVPRRRGSCLVIATRRLLPGEGVGSVRTRSPLILRCARMRIYFGRCRR